METIESSSAWIWAFQAIGVVTAYIGAELNARAQVRGFHLWIVSNVVLAVVHAVSGLWLLLVLDALFLRVNVLGVRKWSSNSRSKIVQKP